jgi:TRAP transporter TAXI family solute receptor
MGTSGLGQEKGGKKMKSYKQVMVGSVIVLLIGLSLSGAFAAGWPPPKPDIITVSTYKIGSNMHMRSAMMGESIFKKFGVKVRVVPIGTDVARVMAVKTKSANFWVTGSGVYSTSEGFGEYATMKWGPHPTRYLWVCNRQTGFGPATTRKSGIKKMADVRGKRVAWVVGNPGLQMQYGAWLSFANLSWDDVKVVKFPSYTKAVRGLIEGKVDMTGVDTVAPIAAEVEAAPRGIYWIPMPPGNTAGWKRVQAGFPLCQPMRVSIGAGIDPKKPVDFINIPAPVFATFEGVDEGLVYWMTKFIAESYEGMEHSEWWSTDANLSAARCAPYHKGSVRYFKEQGKWTAEQEKIDRSYMKRQEILKEAFEAAKAEAKQKGIAGKQFPNVWLKKRAEAVKRAGM